jgi:hypothetical protein
LLLPDELGCVGVLIAPGLMSPLVAGFAVESLALLPLLIPDELDCVELELEPLVSEASLGDLWDIELHAASDNAHTRTAIRLDIRFS